MTKRTITEPNNGQQATEWVTLFKTTYFYWRNWIKDILINGKVKKYRFIKEADTYNGYIAVSKTEKDAAKKVLADYKSKNLDTKEMWWQR